MVVFVAFALLVWRGPAWLDRAGLRVLTPVQRETAVDAFRGRLIQLGAGALALGVLVFTGLTFWLSREGHVTDRYTKAIEQLGSDHLDVRLGAIYAPGGADGHEQVPVGRFGVVALAVVASGGDEGGFARAGQRDAGPGGAGGGDGVQ